MTDPYTPSLEDAREALMFAGWADGHVDRFIAQVRAETLREAADEIDESASALDTGDSVALSYINCTRIDATIVRLRADRIEREGS